MEKIKYVFDEIVKLKDKDSEEVNEMLEEMRENETNCYLGNDRKYEGFSRDNQIENEVNDMIEDKLDDLEEKYNPSRK